MKNKPKTKEQAKEMWLFIGRHYGRDMGAKEIAEKYGVSKQRIEQIALQLRKKGAPIPIIRLRGISDGVVEQLKKEFKA